MESAGCKPHTAHSPPKIEMGFRSKLFPLILLGVLFIGSSEAVPEPTHDRGISRGSALRVLRSFADSGDSEAQLLLGALYVSGTAIPQDYAAAFGWYQKAALQGQRDASY